VRRSTPLLKRRSSMPRTRTSALLAPALLAGALAAGACTTQVRGAVYVPTAPPPPVAEVAPASPGPGYVLDRRLPPVGRRALRLGRRPLGDRSESARAGCRATGDTIAAAGRGCPATGA